VGEDYPQTTRSVAPTPRMGLSESTAKNGEKPRKQEARNGQMNRQDARIAKARSVLSTADTHCQAGAAGANCRHERSERISHPPTANRRRVALTLMEGSRLQTGHSRAARGVWSLEFPASSRAQPVTRRPVHRKPCTVIRIRSTLQFAVCNLISEIARPSQLASRLSLLVTRPCLHPSSLPIHRLGPGR
jgi:hypothetical protein